MVRRRRFRREPDPEIILRLAERIGLEERAVQKLFKTAITTKSSHVRKEVEKHLAMKAANEHLQPFKARPPAITPDEDRIRLGITITGSDFELSQDCLTQHLLAVGKSGAGKTTLFYNLMAQLSVPFWVFDLKQDYRHLIQKHEDLLVLPWTQLKFNPLKPPVGVRPQRWVQVFSEVLGHATALLSGSKNYLMKQMVKLYQQFGLLDEVAPPYPSLLELQMMVKRDKINYVRKTSNYRDTLENRLEAMNRTAGSIFDCSEGYSVDDLLNQEVVFEFDGLNEDTQNFLMEILMAYVYEYRLAQNQRGGEPRHVFFMDEGKRVFSVYKERQDAAGLPTIDGLTAKMREFGEGLIVADQEASKLTDSIKANTDTKILLSTGDAKQFREMAASMFLSERQKELAQQVTLGEAIVQTGSRDPIPVKLDRFELEKTVSDEVLIGNQQGKWDKLSFKEREAIPGFEKATSYESETPTEETSYGSEVVELSKEAKRLLGDVVKDPFKPLGERYELFSSMERGHAAKTELVENQVVKERQVRVRDVRRKLLEVTESGREHLQKELGTQIEHVGRGGVVHRFWQHRIKEIFEEAGWNTEIEKDDADVQIRGGGLELAIEVAMGNNPREIEHVERHLEKFDLVWVACRSKEVLDGLQQRLEENGLLNDRVALRLFRDFSSADLSQIE